MNNQLATHFRTYFQLPAADASALAGAFGLMNLFARSLGGISSDLLFKYVGFRGRIGRNSWPSSSRRSSFSVLDWLTTRNHGMWPWPYLFASLCLSRWQKARAMGLCLS